MKRIHLLLVASLLFALAFTLSCSDDKSGWLTCKELFSLADKCNKKYKAEFNACKTDACEEAVDAKVDQCVISDACNGVSEKQCAKHYQEEDCFDGDDDDDDNNNNNNNGGWLSCDVVYVIVRSCEIQSGCSECSAFDRCIMNSGACGNASISQCEEHYVNRCDWEDDDDDHPTPPVNGQYCYYDGDCDLIGGSSWSISECINDLDGEVVTRQECVNLGADIYDD